MRDLQRRRKIQAFLYSKVTLVLLFVFIFVIGRATWSVYKKNIASAQVAESVRGEAAVLESKQSILAEENKRLDTEKGQEEVIRQKYSVAKPGEEMYIIVDPKDEASSTPEAEGWWGKFGNFLGGKKPKVR